MKYLRKFATEAEYNAFTASEYEAPNVSLLADNDTVKYNLPLGVFIQHIDGTLYTKDEWVANGFANDLANGVAVRTKKIAVVVAKAFLSGSYAWEPQTEAVEGCGTGYSDYNGLANTEAIIKVATSGAAYAASQYVFPNGAKGYLPAMGELSVVYKDNYAEVESALMAIGGASLNPGDYYTDNDVWSSSQYNATMAYYYYNYKGGNFQGRTVQKSETEMVRPFTTL